MGWYNTKMDTLKTTSQSARIDYNIIAIFFGILGILVYFMYTTESNMPNRNLIGAGGSVLSLTGENTSDMQFGINMSGGEFGERRVPGVLNKDYIYPDNPLDYAYFAEKNFTVIRLPVKWERIQRKAYGKLHEPDMKEIENILLIAQNNKQKVILELHNYGRYNGIPLRVRDADKLSDVWKKIAERLADYKAVYGYELMNEPHDLPEGTQGWADIAQQVVDDIRTVDTKRTLFIPGYQWQNAKEWSKKNPTLDITDPAKNMMYTAHIYFDSDLTGTYKKGYDEDMRYTMVGAEESQDFRKWLEEKNAYGMFTEFGVPGDDPKWLAVVSAFLSDVEEDHRIKGVYWWSAGPWWGEYPMSLTPDGNGDKPQMRVLEQHMIR